MIVFVFGTRPECIKIAPVTRELRKQGIAYTLLCTGQHTTLLKGTGLQDDPAYISLDLPSDNNPDRYVARATQAIRHSRIANMARWIVVQGDTASALAGAQAVQDLGIPLAHIEAGLRSGCLKDPWPEEGYRIQIDQLARLRFAPTQTSEGNLEREELDCIVTGNTSVDALRLANVTALKHRSGLLVTLHRRESFGDTMGKMVDTVYGFARSHPDLEITWPVHPNPEVTRHFFGKPSVANLNVTLPIPYLEFLNLLNHSQAVLTDSGGLIEEACTLGIPAVIARNHTERPEATESGSAVLATTKPSSVLKGLEWAVEVEIEPSSVFGDGHASDRIAAILQR